MKVTGQTLRDCDSHHGDSIVVKDRWHVFGGKLVRGVGDEEASLANSTVADNYTSITPQGNVSNHNPITRLCDCRGEGMRECRVVQYTNLIVATTILTASTDYLTK